MKVLLLNKFNAFLSEAKSLYEKNIRKYVFYKRNAILLPFINLFTDMTQIYYLKCFKSTTLLSGFPIIFPAIGAGVWSKYYGDTKRLFCDTFFKDLGFFLLAGYTRKFYFFQFNYKKSLFFPESYAKNITSQKISS